MVFDQNVRDCEPKNKAISPSKMTVSGFLFAVVCFDLIFVHVHDYPITFLWPKAD